MGPRTSGPGGWRKPGGKKAPEMVSNQDNSFPKSKKSIGNLFQHKRAVHEGVTYQCSECDYQSTSKSSLAHHKRAVHEGVKYQCSECDHQSTSKGHLA